MEVTWRSLLRLGKEKGTMSALTHLQLMKDEIGSFQSDSLISVLSSRAQFIICSLFKSRLIGYICMEMEKQNIQKAYVDEIYHRLDAGIDEGDIYFIGFLRGLYSSSINFDCPFIVKSYLEHEASLSEYNINRPHPYSFYSGFSVYTIFDILNLTFSWEDSIEGYDFWHDEDQHFSNLRDNLTLEHILEAPAMGIIS